MNVKNHLTRYGCVLIMSVGAGVAHAQSGGGLYVLEEVVVTAQKRSENLQDVPIAISAISAETLESANLSNIADVATLIPSLGFTQGNDARSSSVRIRGVGTQVFPVGVEPSAAVILDGLVMARPTAAFSKLSDIERVEVLRGPQGTLFGKNSSAGGVHVLTRRPNTEETEGYVRFHVAEDSELDLAAAASGPLSDTVAYRLNGYARSFDGHVENLASGEDDLGQDEGFGVKGQLLFTPSAQFDIRISADVEKRESTNSGATLRFQEDTTYVDATGTPVGEGVDKATRNTDSSFSDNDSWGFSAEANWELGDSTLTYVGGFRSWLDDHSLDEDYTSADAVSVRGGEIDVSTVQHELRLASPTDNWYDYVVGLFYYTQDSDRDFRTTACRRADLLDPEDPTSIDCNDPRDGGYDTTVDSENMAIFGQINFHPSDDLTLLLGLRALREEQDFSYRRVGANGLRFINESGARTAIDPPYTDGTDDDDVIGKVGAIYNISESVNLYATFSTGYKGQAYFNAGGILTEQLLGTGDLGTLYPLDPETSDSYEIGSKGLFFDDRLQLNVALFRTEFNDFQSQIRNPVNQINLLINSGQVLTQGIEVEFTALATENLMLFGGVTYLEATFEDFGDFPVSCPGPLQGTSRCFFDDNGAELINVEGEQIQNAPELAYVISARYDIPTGSGRDWYLQGSYRWQDDVIYSLNQDPRTEQDAFGILDLSIGGSFGDGRYEWSVYGKNVLDEEHYRSVNVIGSLFNPSRSANGVAQVLPRDFSRYFGARLTVNF